MIVTKQCSKCKLEKDFSQFYKNKVTKDGLQAICKDCVRQYYENNKIEIKAKRKEYSKNNADEGRARGKKWRQNNPDKEKARTKKYRKNNKDKISSKKKEWRENNKDKIKAYNKAYSKKWRKNNPEKIKTNKRKRRAMKLRVNENYTLKDESVTKKAFNSQCFLCKSVDNLCIDHHRPLSKGNPLSSHNAVVLCVSCNSSKGNLDPEEFYGIEVCEELDNKLKNI